MGSKVAVIMSVYKNDNILYLKDAIDSMCQQTMPFSFFIYVDGKISDQLQEYLNSICFDGFLNIIYGDENRGLAFSLNTLINEVLKHKDIEYIARMDSDDISLSERLKKQSDFFDNNAEVDILGSACEEFGTDYAAKIKSLPSKHNELVKFSITRCPFIHPSVMFRRGVFEQGNRYPTHTRFTEDMAFWLDLLYRKYKFHNLPEILLKYRLAPETMNRRHGIDKANSEVSLRIGYMFLLKQVSFKNFLLIYARYLFHLLPSGLMSLAYKYLR